MKAGLGDRLEGGPLEGARDRGVEPGELRIEVADELGVVRDIRRVGGLRRRALDDRADDAGEDDDDEIVGQAQRARAEAGLALADLGLTKAVGSDGSRTEVLALATPPSRERGRTVTATDGEQPPPVDCHSAHCSDPAPVAFQDGSLLAGPGIPHSHSPVIATAR